MEWIEEFYSWKSISTKAKIWTVYSSSEEIFIVLKLMMRELCGEELSTYVDYNPI